VTEVQPSKRVAAALVSHAARILPAERADWARAMVAEVEHIDGRFAAIRWAFGCTLASYQERIRDMNHSKLDVPRWLLCVEILVCLAPLTLLWTIAMYMVVVAKASATSIVVPTVIGTIGPIGLLLALRLVVMRRPVTGTSFAILSFCFAVLAALLYLAPGVTWFASDWRVWMLISVLPCVACAHLAFIRFASMSPSALQVK
jgi:hypothetical protein